MKKLAAIVVPVLILLTAANSFWPGEVSGQSTSDKRTSASVIYEAVAATNATLWLMEDARLFEKYGLNAKVIHARGAVPVQALVSNSVEFGAFGGPSGVALAHRRVRGFESWSICPH
jgi:ABC-type nitrate/sulfonate/bicarbonate transport system substrate-binding protein